MLSFILAFFFSTFITLWLIRTANLHAKFSNDNSKGPQKFHQGSVPRIGGIGIYLSIILSVCLQCLIDNQIHFEKFLFIACTIPCFIIGLSEDITKKVGIKQRLLFTALSGLLAIHFLDSIILKVEIPIFDELLKYTWFAYFFSCFAVTGIANAYNIIDGFNGLASMVCAISLLAIAYIAHVVGDSYIFSLSIIMIGAILGFFIWNYPRGLIFLGDGGAYIIGLWCGLMTLLLVDRNSSVSPWFAFVVNGYPIFETLFTIWRRAIHQGRNPGLPDAAHFHSLIYRRVVKWAEVGSPKVTKDIKFKNAKTSPYLWMLSTLSVIPAVLFWNNSTALKISVALFCIIYVILYRWIVSFNKRSWKFLLPMKDRGKK